ncbi:hypothetical protein pb186bvf_016416 [Paramecium bursaria]
MNSCFLIKQKIILKNSLSFQEGNRKSEISFYLNLEQSFSHNSIFLNFQLIHDQIRNLIYNLYLIILYEKFIISNITLES